MDVIKWLNKYIPGWRQYTAAAWAKVYSPSGDIANGLGELEGETVEVVDVGGTIAVGTLCRVPSAYIYDI